MIRFIQILLIILLLQYSLQTTFSNSNNIQFKVNEKNDAIKIRQSLRQQIRRGVEEALNQQFAGMFGRSKASNKPPVVNNNRQTSYINQNNQGTYYQTTPQIQLNQSSNNNILQITQPLPSPEVLQAPPYVIVVNNQQSIIPNNLRQNITNILPNINPSLNTITSTIPHLISSPPNAVLSQPIPNKQISFESIFSQNIPVISNELKQPAANNIALPIPNTVSINQNQLNNIPVSPNTSTNQISNTGSNLVQPQQFINPIKIQPITNVMNLQPINYNPLPNINSNINNQISKPFVEPLPYQQPNNNFQTNPITQQQIQLNNQIQSAKTNQNDILQLSWTNTIQDPITNSSITKLNGIIPPTK